MPTRLVHLAVDSADISLIARFWADLLGWPILLEETDEVCIEPEGGGVGIAFVPVPEPKTVKNRVHLDLHVGADRREDEVARLLGLGATELYRASQGPFEWATLADPEGNEFCVA